MESSRAQRKQTNRVALIRAAHELFQSSGPDDTTLEQVAAKAGVHVQTLYRHFATKNDLAAAIDQDYLARFIEEVEKRPAGSDILGLWRDWVDRCSREVTRNREERHRKNLRRFWATPTLSMNLLRVWYQYEELLTREIAKDAGVDPEQDSLPRLIACMLWAGNVNAARRWSQGDSTQSLNQVCVAVVDDVIALFGDRIRPKASSPRAHHP